VCMQAISSETGRVIDDFVLKKAANYASNITARNNFLASGFQSTYQPSVLEVNSPVLPCFLLTSNLLSPSSSCALQQGSQCHGDWLQSLSVDVELVHGRMPTCLHLLPGVY
jgi:hypothetical protein